MNRALDLTVMMYHYIRDEGDDAEMGSGIPGMAVRAFEMQQLDALSRQHTFVTWPQVCLALQADQPLPDFACLLTFDDGIRDHYVNVFKVLRERNLSGLFFALARQEDEELTLAHRIHFLLAKLGLLRFRDAIWETLNSEQRRQYTEAEKRYQRNSLPNSVESQINLLKAVLQRELSNEINGLLSELFETYIGLEQEIARSYYLKRGSNSRNVRWRNAFWRAQSQPSLVRPD